MRLLVDTWRSIGARLYLALGFAVLLTLASSAVGVYYFEQSGDLNFRARSESVPVLEASWAAVRESERLRALGLGLLAEPGIDFPDLRADSVTESLKRLEDALAKVSGVPALEQGAQVAYDAAYDLAEVIDDLEVQRRAVLDANAAAASLQTRLKGLLADSGLADRALSVLLRALLADDEAALQGLWNEFAAISAGGVDPVVGANGRWSGGVHSPRSAAGAAGESRGIVRGLRRFEPCPSGSGFSPANRGPRGVHRDPGLGRREF